MAGKGGGAWKVAYADFVTAMMAFFLVMWITAQDQKVKKAVAYYFTDPLGASKKPGKTGSVSDSPNNGAIPDSERVAAGSGRHAFSVPDETSRSTKMVNDFIHVDKKTHDYWVEQGKRQREEARRSKDVQGSKKTAEEVAIQQLAKQMRQEMAEGIPQNAKGVYQDILFDAMSSVNWTELAEEILNK